jgi:hypothetical protein
MNCAHDCARSFCAAELFNRDGYAWLGAWPRALVDEEYPAWKKREAPR